MQVDTCSIINFDDLISKLQFKIFYEKMRKYFFSTVSQDFCLAGNRISAEYTQS